MLELNYIRENKNEVISGLEKRNFKDLGLIEEIILTDKSRRDTQKNLDSKLHEANSLTKEIGLFFKSGNIKKAENFKLKSAEIKTTTKLLQEKLDSIEKKLSELRFQVPNIPNSIVKKGFSEKDNEEIETFGKINKLEENLIPHWELAKKYNLIDFDLGSKITGAGFPVYIDKGAKLQRALINFFIDKNVKAGYREIQVPLLVNEASGIGTGQLPDKEGQMYHVNNENLYLIPTSEVPLTNIYRNKIINENALPIKMTSYTPCFRREAGSYGSHVRGLNRLHQFDKVEIVEIVKPGESDNALNKMISHVKDILIELELPSRILRLCSGDLGFTSSLTYDFELYSVGQKKWLEVSSVSNFESFQSERLQLRYKTKKGEKNLLHTLNGSSLALPRVIAALLENNQSKDGIRIPKALLPYTNFDMIY
ncbi:MAG: serine--tRNA ligase [Flavobacteriaceae bacterium]